MTRAFAFLDDKNQPRIGVEWGEEPTTGPRTRYDFTRAWDLFKQIKLSGKGPHLTFLQLMVELDLFHAETFDEVFTTLQDFQPLEDLILTKAFPYQVPISRPQKIICIGRNYREHANELQNQPPKEPIFFAKSPSALIAHEQAVRIPQDAGRVDHEAELAVIIGKTGANLTNEKAMEYVAAYTIMNDVTARELQKKDTAAGLPWFRAKSFDTFCPLGPYLIPAGNVPNPQALEVKLTVNDEIRQQGNTADMIFPVRELISTISHFCTLQAGDVIATGTPAGVGPLRPGDRMVATVTGFGELINPIV